jgi:hypothetical protein
MTSKELLKEVLAEVPSPMAFAEFVNRNMLSKWHPGRRLSKSLLH